MSEKILLTAIVPEELQGCRLDQVAAKLFPDYSRGRLQNWIKSASLKVNQQCMRPKDKLFSGQKITIDAELETEESWQAEPITLDVVYEDAQLIVVNKNAGLVVHPAAGNRSGTLLNALLHHCPELATVPRAGIVHRLDKDTTGLMVVAKTLAAHSNLIKQMQMRSVSREYEAVVTGVLTAGGTVDLPIARHPRQRKKMAVVEGGKVAVTHYRLVEKFRAHTHIRLKLETGRTHQIRVHMSHMRYPMVGDQTYAGRLQMPKAASPSLVKTLQQFKRQALHASRLGLSHPHSGEAMGWQAELPSDMCALLQALKNDSAKVQVWGRP